MYTDFAPKGIRWPHGLAEMNVLAHLAQPVHMRVMEIPKTKTSGCFDLRLHSNGSYACLPTPNCPNPEVTCRQYSLHIMRSMEAVRTYVARLATFFGADWFRFDYFYGHPQRMLRVNEVSYPSHHTYPSDIRDAWLAAYTDSVDNELAQSNSDAIIGAPKVDSGPNVSHALSGGEIRPRLIRSGLQSQGPLTHSVSSNARSRPSRPTSLSAMLEVPSHCIME